MTTFKIDIENNLYRYLFNHCAVEYTFDSANSIIITLQCKELNTLCSTRGALIEMLEGLQKSSITLYQYWPQDKELYKFEECNLIFISEGADSIEVTFQYSDIFRYKNSDAERIYNGK